MHGGRRAAAILREARSVVILTGAGVSAESGVPTFRDALTGLYAGRDPEDLASSEGFRRDPGLVWRWYMERFGRLDTVEPNPGHLAIAALEQRLPLFRLITQNVDDLHERAGNDSVLHLHGSIREYRCSACGRPYELQPEDRTAEEPPRCDECNRMIRPGVVWFGESLPVEVLTRAQELAARCKAMLVVGTSGVVYPAAELPYVAKTNGATVIDVNPEATGISRLADLYLRGPGGEVLPEIVEALDELDERA